MTMRFKFCLFFAWLLFLSAAHAVELTGRASIFGSVARDFHGKSAEFSDQTQNADQQSLRLMLDETQENSEWNIHLKIARQHSSGFPYDGNHSSDLFRYRTLSGDWHNEQNGNNTTIIGYELDRAAYKQRFDQTTLSLGRQPIDWGSGRFWQPLNVFGAFAPTDLDTDFKPGIDAAVFDWFPSAFSSLTAVYAFSPKSDATLKDSAALHYKRQVGERSEIALLAGQITGNNVIGASFESEWAGMGWRIEGAHHRLKDDNALFWIAGIDYQFNGGTLITAEWHEDGRGAKNEEALTEIQSTLLAGHSLQTHLSRRVLGISASKDMTPLLHGSYKLFISPLKDATHHTNFSVLHQLSFVYSVSNESDFLLSLLYATGKGLNDQGVPQSEYGHVPASLTARYRYYF